MKRSLAIGSHACFVLWTLVGCADAARYCNVDADCGAGVCVAGECGVRGTDDRPEGARVPGEGGGADDDDGEIGCEGSGTAFLDEDGDGFTGAAIAWCEGTPLPQGARASRGDAPVHLIEPADVTVRDGQWDVDAMEFFHSGASPDGTLAVSGFACAGALERASGLEIVVTLDGASAPPTALSVWVETTSGASTERTTTVDASDAQVRIGGAGDTLGLALTPEMVCDPSFTVVLRVAPETQSAAAIEARVAAVFVYGATDCADNDAARFSPAELREDADLDGFAGGLRLPACVGYTVPSGRGVRERDCAPDDSAAFPGQSQRFARERIGVGGWDFDCDGNEEPLEDALADMSSCTISADGTSCNVWYSSVTPSCGETIAYGDCTGACIHAVRSFTQLCR